MKNHVPLLLASASPRRGQLLRQLGVVFDVAAVDVVEAVRAGEAAPDYVLRVAGDKLEASLARHAGRMTLAADTSVVLGSHILGKPSDREQARQMLRRLSGHRHQVLTAVAIGDGRRHRRFLQRSSVTFARLNETEIAAYLATGEADDKAGAYGIQGAAAAFIVELSGSYSGVMGLPLHETYHALRALDVPVLNTTAQSAVASAAPE